MFPDSTLSVMSRKGRSSFAPSTIRPRRSRRVRQRRRGRGSTVRAAVATDVGSSRVVIRVRTAFSSLPRSAPAETGSRARPPRARPRIAIHLPKLTERAPISPSRLPARFQGRCGSAARPSGPGDGPRDLLFERRLAAVLALVHRPVGLGDERVEVVLLAGMAERDADVSGRPASPSPGVASCDRLLEARLLEGGKGLGVPQTANTSPAIRPITASGAQVLCSAAPARRIASSPAS